MAEASLQDRLRDHAKAFDGLLSLIPAKMYYGEDNTDQWKRKRQTKEETAAAKRGRLDPDSELNRNAKEVLDERAKNKRKLREMEQDDGDEDEELTVPEGIEAEQPGQGLKKHTDEPTKKQKRAPAPAVADEEYIAQDKDAIAETEDHPKMTKREKKKAAKKEKQKEKKVVNGANPDLADEAPSQKEETATEETQVEEKDDARRSKKKKTKSSSTAARSVPQPEPDDNPNLAEADKDSVDFSGLQEEDVDGPSPPESNPLSPTFDANLSSTSNADQASTSTSISSIVPPSEKPKHIKVPADTSAVQARVAARIEALRAARKADGSNGKPIRTRQELIESRRVKEAQKKAHKKELRRVAKAEEARKREEALACNSPSVMSPALELDEATGNFAFGRVAFGDGTQLSHDLSYVLNKNHKKGPSDPKTALLKVQNQKKRLEGLDEEARKDIAEKEAWLTARRRVEGEKIRDDEATLKKAVKRKDIAKRKSEKAWKERSQGVASAQKERQKKREENIRKRREDKMLGKAGKKKGKSGGAAGKKKGRPGFEGSLGVGGGRRK